ncbi:hypothetical protein ACIQFU_02375 [Streptomyces sp. NPDC093065]|uniref:hypothetical protein n=1 Tax=Streptomyces sp. NPDC093065 TaxID=3366021 RepID=UPI00381C5B0F
MTPPRAPGAGAVAGRVRLHEVMGRLRGHRPVFHSEADLRHAFARVRWETAPEIESRLEVPRRRPGRAEYLDLLCIGPAARTAVEFKHFTRGWTGAAGTPAEDYLLKKHGATDLARLHFVRDIAGLERFCGRSGPRARTSRTPAPWRAPAPWPGSRTPHRPGPAGSSADVPRSRSAAGSR